MNLIPRQAKILNHLYSFHEWQTGKELSSLFQVSIRTIRNDIYTINKEYKNEVILSSKHYGYKLNLSIYSAFQNKVNTVVSSDERVLRILIEMLTKPNVPFHFYDLADQYFISEYTLSHDINTIKNILLDHPFYNVFIDKRNEYIHINGTNNDCGKILHACIKNSRYYKSFIDFDDCFENVELKKIKTCIDSTFDLRYYTRYLTFEDVFILTSIFLEQAYHMDSNTKTKSSMFEQQQHIHIDSYLNKFKKGVSEYAFAYFKQHFLSALNPLIEIEKEEMIIKKNTSVDDPLFPILFQILGDVHQIFSLNICTQEKVIIDFLVHIKIALLRMKKGVASNNPLLEYIRLNYTFLFDVAYYISRKLSKHLNQEFTKDEISYFVVYLINPLKTMKENLLQHYNVDILLYVIEGPSISQNIHQIVMENAINNHIQIATVESSDDFNKTNINFYDLLITTSTHIKNGNIKICYIDPLISRFNIMQMNTLIEKIYNEKRNESFDQLFDFFFSKKLSAFHSKIKDENECIRNICEHMKTYELIPPNYFEQVLERENLISTAFDTGISLPHATENSAFKSSIFFMNLEYPIDWNGKKVKSVFLFAIAKEDINLLNLIYRIIINICSSDVYAIQLNKIACFEQLKELMRKVYIEL